MESIRQAATKNRYPVWLRVLMAASAAWAVQLHYGLAAADRGAGLVDLAVCVSLYLLFTLRGRTPASKSVRVRSLVLAAVFTLLLACLNGWFSILRYERFTDPPLYTAYYCNAFVGTFLLLFCGISLLLDTWSRVALCPDAPVDGARARRAFFLTFALCAAVYFVFLLNQYPGSMESDHMRQLLHLLEGRYDNRNPLVNSLCVFGCVRLMQSLGGSMNAGVFLYSILQLLLLSAVFAFGVSLTVRAGFPKWIVRAVAAFCAFAPYNIFYSYGMWKDTFFSAWLLLTIFAVWNLLLVNKAGKRARTADYALLFAASLLASLSRNSGWSALLVFLPCCFLLLRGLPVRKWACASVGGGVALALLIMGPLFSALRVEKTADSVTALCVPLQQVAAVIKKDKPLTADETDLIEQLAPVTDIYAAYDPVCADPMKDLVYPAIGTLDANLGAYGRLWVRLGLRYPLTYARAYLALMRMYVDPSVSSEVAYKWVYQNDFGVYRDPKLLPKLDFGYYESVLELPAVNLLKRPGAVLWCIVLLWQLCALRNNRRVRLLYVPLLAVFCGLFVTAPVALFRYVYSAMACLPFLLLWPFWNPDGK